MASDLEDNGLHKEKFLSRDRKRDCPFGTSLNLKFNLKNVTISTVRKSNERENK